MASDLGDMNKCLRTMTKYLGGENMSFHDRICLDIASQSLDIKISAYILRLYMFIFGIVTICNGFVVAIPLLLIFLGQSRQQNSIRYSMQIYSR